MFKGELLPLAQGLLLLEAVLLVMAEQMHGYTNTLHIAKQHHQQQQQQQQLCFFLLKARGRQRDRKIGDAEDIEAPASKGFSFTTPAICKESVLLQCTHHNRTRGCLDI